MNEVDIGSRAKKILHAVVSEYLATGEAVGSQTVTRRYGLDVSAATVRNVMGSLEEIGLLKHTHTSGGRIPTERGLRYYVDTLLRVRSLTTGEKDDIRERIPGAPAGQRRGPARRVRAAQREPAAGGDRDVDGADPEQARARGFSAVAGGSGPDQQLPQRAGGRPDPGPDPGPPDPGDREREGRPRRARLARAQ